MLRSLPPRTQLPHTTSHPTAPYLRITCLRTCSDLVASSSLARPRAAGPVGLPRAVHGATPTAPSLRRRLTLPAPPPVHISSSSSSSTTHTGVGTDVPSLRNVVTSRYLPAASRALSVCIVNTLRHPHSCGPLDVESSARTGSRSLVAWRSRCV